MKITKTILAMMFVALMSNAYAADEKVVAMSAEDAQIAAAEIAAPVELVPVQSEPSSADTVDAKPDAKPQEAKHGNPATVSGVLSALGQTARIVAFVATFALPFGSRGHDGHASHRCGGQHSCEDHCIQGRC
jgi:hypothetical protein